jgi:hypothetical protein
VKESSKKIEKIIQELFGIEVTKTQAGKLLKDCSIQ